MPKITLNIWLSLIPLILQVINTVEDMFGPGTGPEKKQSALDMIKEGFNSLPLIFGVEKVKEVPTFDVLQPVISVTIDIWVKILNFLGIFKK